MIFGRTHRRMEKRKLMVHKMSRGASDNRRDSIETISNFHLIGDEMQQKYMVHYKNGRASTAVPANEVSATRIHLYWTETFSGIAQDLEVKKSRELTKEETKAHYEQVIAVQNLQKLKAAGGKLELGINQERMPADIRRINHRLANGHPNPFGKQLEAGDVLESDSSSDEEEVSDPRERNRRMQERMKADLDTVKKEILEGKTTMEEVEREEDPKFVECLKKWMEKEEDSEDADEAQTPVDSESDELSD